MSSTYYTKDHEWILVDGDTVTIGITDYAQEQLGEVVYVELPEVGTEVGVGDETGVVESVKAASEIYSPIAGKITGVNEDLNDDPAQVNSDAEGTAWFFKMTLANAAELDGLMDAAAYKALLEELA